MKELIRNVIKKTAEKLGVDVEEIILFGSRARGDFRRDSDWDVLIVTREKIPRAIELELYKLVHRELLFNGVKADILLISRDELEAVKEDRSYVYYYALREGIKV
ncbi:nucleotidyltransferase domain-containing protein [Thermococcus stetteri]|uniref:nucleotidyltransferase domain-containing protein n=1 Tax=Thermococcus stetteri TaxID=49900 RepID=UPI001AE6F4F6|nr:nucleotidyltransferase domain-containing protein [Thermococcus stetteri]MBP1912985.1 putative nucleotidyltransferase [Thermococcus stetteri]